MALSTGGMAHPRDKGVAVPTPSRTTDCKPLETAACVMTLEDDYQHDPAARDATVFVVSLPMQMRVQLSICDGPGLHLLARDVNVRPDCVVAHLLSLYSKVGIDLTQHQSDRILVLDLSAKHDGVYVDFVLIPEVVMAELRSRCVDADAVYVIPSDTANCSIRSYPMHSDPQTIQAPCFERLEDMLQSCGACVKLPLADVHGGRSVYDLVTSAHAQVPLRA